MKENNETILQDLHNNVSEITNKIEIMNSQNQQSIADLRQSMAQQIEVLNGNFCNNIQNLSGQMESESSFNEKTKEQINILFSRIDDIHEKLYEFETNKKNNLIFYGIPGDMKESKDDLRHKIANLLKLKLNIRREIPILRASRMLTGLKFKKGLQCESFIN